MDIDDIVGKEIVTLRNGLERPIEYWYRNEPEAPKGAQNREVLYPPVSDEEARSMYTPFKYVLHVLKLRN